MVKLIVTFNCQYWRIDGLETIHHKFSHCNKSRRGEIRASLEIF